MTLQQEQTPPVNLRDRSLTELIESAVVLRHGINDVMRQAEAEVAPMAAALSETEAELRRRALQRGESIVGSGLAVRYTREGTTVRWNDDGLMGAMSVLPADQRNALLCFRTESPRAAGTQLVYDKSKD